MPSPIINGLIAELNRQLNLERVVAMSVGLAVAIHDDEDDRIGDDFELFNGCNVGDLREYGDFWENPMFVCGIVAALLESETQRIANPILANWPDATAEDRNAIIHATDNVQIEAMSELVDRCRQMWSRPTVQRNADGSEDGFWTFFTRNY